MESGRLKKVNKLLQKELGILFQQESKTLFQGAFITVTEVRCSPDLSYAKAFLSFFMVKDNKFYHEAKNREALLKLIDEQKSVIRNKIGQLIKNQIRVIPEFDFRIDDSLDRAMRIDELLKK